MSLCYSHRTVLLLAAFITAVGCNRGPFPTYEAEGRVTFSDGTALERGWVEFESIEHQPPLTARGEIQSDGTFFLTTFKQGDGAIEGRHRAVVVVPLPEGVGDDPRQLELSVDPRFGQFDTAGLEFVVGRNADENVFRIRVEPPTGRPL